MNTCKTCKYWVDPDPDDDFYADNAINDRDENCCPTPIRSGFQCKVCEMPGKTYFEPPKEINGFALIDAEMYYAALITAEDFGCVRHESNND